MMSSSFTAAWSIAVVTAVLTTIITLISIWNHLKNYRRPDLQRHIIRIMLMPLIYGITSCLAFGFHQAGDYLEPIRDCYEAFVLWMFFQLMVGYLGGERELLLRMDDGRLPIKHPLPFNWCLLPMDLSFPENFILLKRGILQFVIVKPVHALLVIILRSAGVYREGVITYDTAYVYLALLYNISVCVSMYCLVLFYMATRYDLAPHRPMFKFLCIKTVIFFSFWQGFLISVLVKVQLIRDGGSAASIQNFIICMEMLVAAVAHSFAFSYGEYEELPSSRLPLNSAIRDVMGFNDLLLEARYTLRGTDFRLFNDNQSNYNQGSNLGQLTSSTTASRAPGDDSRTPLLGGSLENNFGGGGGSGGVGQTRFVRAYTGLQFGDLVDDPDLEEMFESARQFKDGDYNYRVIDKK